MIAKKITAAAAAIALAAGTAAYLPMNTDSSANVNAAASNYNYAEALQKSMFFYEVQQAGILPEWNEVTWRADSMVDENGVETDIVPGGWFDAGDHFKFCLTNAYSASVMAWGYIQYKDAVDKSGLGELYRNNIQWAMDFVMNCDRGDKVIGTIGDFTGGSTDHNIWCSAEVYLRKHHLNNDDWERPYDEIENASVEALAAACLAEGYIIFKDDQPEKAEEYLEHAKSLFELADKTRACKDIGGMAGMYDTSSWLDDCMYAANWLYMATGDKSYLDKIESDYIPEFPLENQSTDKKFTWGFCWDDTSQGAALLYAMNTGNQEWIDHVSHHLDYWIDGYNGKKIDYTPDGLAWLFQWGSLRHATSTAWLAFLAGDTIFADNSALSTKYQDWAKSQMDYAFGDNDLGQCYVLGMGDLNPTAIHHRTASGIHDDHWNELGQPDGGAEGWQTEYAHTLYGALVGGPDREGKYVNAVSQYQYSEVAIDYNAGYTAALCAMVDNYGGEILDNFPPTEEPKWAEWEIAAVLNGSGNSYTEIKAWAMNHTAWPARVEKNISYNYYFDVSEVLEAGLSVDDITIKCGSQQYQEGQQGYATVSGPFKYEGDPSGNTYYAKIQFEDGRAIQPTGQSEHRDEVQFRISIPDAIDGKPTTGAWDPSNDWSYKGVEDATDLKKPDSLNDHITMYVNDVLVWGTEPDGTTPQPTEPTTKPQQETTAPATEGTTASGDRLWGDADLDGKVGISDVVKVMMYVSNKETNPLEEEGKLNADVFQNGDGVFIADALSIQKKVAQSIDTLPES